MAGITFKPARGQHWVGRDGVIHRIDYTYRVGAVLLTCEGQVSKKDVVNHITTDPVTCLFCHDTREVFGDY